MVSAYMLGPMLAYKLGVPRLDNLLTIVLILGVSLIALTETTSINPKTFPALLAIAVMSLWSALHLLVSPLTQVQFMDLLFFISLPFLFYLLYLIISRHDTPLAFIRRVLVVFTLFIAAPPFIEIITGTQFLQSSETLDLSLGVVKGLFFNPNNLGTTALCFAPAILVFFNTDVTPKEHKIGWLLFLALGLVVFVSASRTATVCYIILLITHLIYRGNPILTVATVSLSGILLSMIPKQMIGNFLLSMSGNIFLENMSSRLYLFLFELESDNSVGYRQEIYNYFWSNPPFLFLGYGPKNFSEYFSGHLSNSLGFENPHSFIIELYLGFGIISLLGFICFLGVYVLRTLLTKQLHNKQQFLALVAIGLFVLAGFIPSTILRLPFIWLPCFMILIYCALPYRHQSQQIQIKE